MRRTGTYGLRRRFRSLLWRPPVQDEVSEEVAFHLEMRERELVERGMDEDEARTEARRRFGDLGRIEDDCRRIAARRNKRMRLYDTLEDLSGDLRYALRQLVRKPSFTLMVTLTLGVAIGANTAVFSVVNGLLLRPLPVPDADELVVVAARQKNKNLAMGISYPALQEVRKATTEGGDAVFSDLAGFSLGLVGIATQERAEQTLAAYVTGSFFSMMRIEAGHGRLLLPGEGEVAGKDHVVVLGHTFWQRHLQGDPGIVGKTVRLNGSLYTVVGVAPESFRGPVPMVDMGAYLPFANYPDFDKWKENRETYPVRTMGRLLPGVSKAKAEASLAVVADRLARDHERTDAGVGLVLFRETMSRPEPPAAERLPVPMTIFLMLVGLVLLVACFNVANLLLLRATMRRGEIAVRSALGAGRGRLMRQLLTESLVLAAGGGALGAALAVGIARYLEALPMPNNFPVILDFSPDARVMGYVALAVVLTGILAGLAPAMRSSRFDLTSALHERGRSAAGGATRHRLRNGLVVAQVAISLLVLTTAGLFVRIAHEASRIDLGFTTEGVLKLHLDPSQVGYDEQRTASFYRELRDRAAALPGVEASGMSYSAPMGHYGTGGRVAAEGTVVAGEDSKDEAWIPLVFNTVDPHFFATLEMPIVGGRPFDERDTAASARVAVVNEKLAMDLWGETNVLGRRFHLASATGAEFLEVVGVSRNARDLIPFGPQQPFLYVPFAQRPTSLRVLYLRTRGIQATSLVPAVRSLIHDLEPALAPTGIGEMSEVLRDDVNGFFLPRFASVVASAIGLLGLVLATVGLYGVVASAASQRRQEIGVRMALGADRGMILRMVIGQGLVLVGIGLAVGLVLGLGATKLVGSLLFGGSANDLATSVTVVSLLVGAALLACWLPARRASAVEVTRALRCE